MISSIYHLIWIINLHGRNESVWQCTRQCHHGFSTGRYKEAERPELDCRSFLRCEESWPGSKISQIRCQTVVFHYLIDLWPAWRRPPGGRCCPAVASTTGSTASSSGPWCPCSCCTFGCRCSGKIPLVNPAEAAEMVGGLEDSWHGRRTGREAFHRVWAAATWACPGARVRSAFARPPTRGTRCSPTTRCPGRGSSPKKRALIHQGCPAASVNRKPDPVQERTTPSRSRRSFGRANSAQPQHHPELERSPKNKRGFKTCFWIESISRLRCGWWCPWAVANGVRKSRPRRSVRCPRPFCHLEPPFEAVSRSSPFHFEASHSSHSFHLELVFELLHHYLVLKSLANMSMSNTLFSFRCWDCLHYRRAKFERALGRNGTVLSNDTGVEDKKETFATDSHFTEEEAAIDSLSSCSNLRDRWIFRIFCSQHEVLTSNFYYWDWRGNQKQKGWL